MINEPLINALNCAIQVLEGNGGGFSSQEQYNAKLELMKLLAQEESK
jgi:hypothetical protein